MMHRCHDHLSRYLCHDDAATSCCVSCSCLSCIPSFVFVVQIIMEPEGHLYADITVMHHHALVHAVHNGQLAGQSCAYR